MRGAAKSNRTRRCGITLPVALVRHVDNIRGDVPRSTFIRRAIEKYIPAKGSNNDNAN